MQIVYTVERIESEEGPPIFENPDATELLVGSARPADRSRSTNLGRASNEPQRHRRAQEKTFDCIVSVLMCRSRAQLRLLMRATGVRTCQHQALIRHATATI